MSPELFGGGALGLQSRMTTREAVVGLWSTRLKEMIGKYKEYRCTKKREHAKDVTSRCKFIAKQMQAQKRSAIVR